ncbi:MAG: hypothetical protein P8185_04830 [Deltaproteobacteria bacterium]|jgi:hypothetical protein
MTKPVLNHIVQDKDPTGRSAYLRFTWMVLIVIIGGCTAALMKKEPNPPVVGEPVIAGNLKNANISEASGLASSRLYPGLLWTINDGGGGPLLYAVGVDGSDLGAFRVEGAENVDWEALSSFRWQGAAYLLIADVGDNWEQRQAVTLYAVKEPVLTAGGIDNERVATIAWQIRFTYEDGPQDCEAVAVDAVKQRVLLLSKRRLPPVLYELSLGPVDQDIIAVAHRISTVPHFIGPTAMDLTPDGLSAVVLTYNNGYLFRRKKSEDWPSTFQRKPQRLRFERLFQQEAASFGFFGKSVFVTSEGLRAPLVRIDLETEATKP